VNLGLITEANFYTLSLTNVAEYEHDWGMSEYKNNDPMHGMTLEKILIALEAYYGWDELGVYVNIRCFNNNPSIKSSLAFLRKTPWARTKVESLYQDMVRQQQPDKAPY